jgi:flagellar motility protein MotE (MotC chaperone)
MTRPVRTRRLARRRPPHRLGLVLAAAMQTAAASAEPRPSGAGKAEDARPTPYCAGIANAAADARFAWQTEALAALSRDVEVRIRQLEAKRAEYEDWLRRRDAFLAKADESVTAIYAKMRPEAASQQLTAMDAEAAAAILTRLDARVASAILNEMEPGRAARLANVITNTPPKNPAPSRPDATTKVPAEPRPNATERRPQDGETSG